MPPARRRAAQSHVSHARTRVWGHGNARRRRRRRGRRHWRPPRSSVVGRARGRVCGGAPLVTAASKRHLTSHRDKDCAGWVLSDQVSRLVRSACSSRLAARSHGRQRDRQRHRARAVRSFRDDRQHPLGIQVGDVGLRCAWPACDGAVGGRRSAVGGRRSAAGGWRSTAAAAAAALGMDGGAVAASACGCIIFVKKCLFKKNNRGTRRTWGRPPHVIRARTPELYETRAVLMVRNSAATPDERV